MLDWKLEVPAVLIKYYEEKVLEISPNPEDLESTQIKIDEVLKDYDDRCREKLNIFELMNFATLPGGLDDVLKIDDACHGVNAMDRTFLNCYDCKTNKLSCYCQVCFKKEHSDSELADTSVENQQSNSDLPSEEKKTAKNQLPSFRIHKDHDIRLRQTNGFCRNTFKLFYNKQQEIIDAVAHIKKFGPDALGLSQQFRAETAAFIIGVLRAACDQKYELDDSYGANQESPLYLLLVGFFEKFKTASKIRFGIAIILTDILIAEIEITGDTKQKKTKKGIKTVRKLANSEIDKIPHILAGLMCHPLLPYDMNAAFCQIAHITCNFTDFNIQLQEVVFSHLLFYKAQEEFDEDDEHEEREKKKIIRNSRYHDLLMVKDVQIETSYITNIVLSLVDTEAFRHNMKLSHEDSHFLSVMFDSFRNAIEQSKMEKIASLNEEDEEGHDKSGFYVFLSSIYQNIDWLISNQENLEIVMADEFFSKNLARIAYDFHYNDSFDGKESEYSSDELDAMVELMTHEGEFISFFTRVIKHINKNRAHRIQWLERLLKDCIIYLLDFQKQSVLNSRYVSPLVTLNRCIVILIFNIVDLRQDWSEEQRQKFQTFIDGNFSHQIKFAEFDEIKTVVERVFGEALAHFTAMQEAEKSDESKKKKKKQKESPSLNKALSKFFFMSSLQLFKLLGFMREVYLKVWAFWGDDELQTIVEDYHNFQTYSQICDFAYIQLAFNFMEQKHHSQLIFYFGVGGSLKENGQTNLLFANVESKQLMTYFTMGDAFEKSVFLFNDFWEMMLLMFNLDTRNSGLFRAMIHVPTYPSRFKNLRTISTDEQLVSEFLDQFEISAPIKSICKQIVHSMGSCNARQLNDSARVFIVKSFPLLIYALSFLEYNDETQIFRLKPGDDENIMEGYFYSYLNRFEPSGTQLFNFLIEKKVYPQYILQGDNLNGNSKASKSYMPSLEYIYQGAQLFFENSGFIVYCSNVNRFSQEELEQLFHGKKFKDHLKSLCRGTDLYFGFLERNMDAAPKISKSKRLFLRTHFCQKILAYLKEKGPDYISQNQLDYLIIWLEKLCSRLKKIREKLDPIPTKPSEESTVKETEVQEAEQVSNQSSDPFQSELSPDVAPKLSESTDQPKTSKNEQQQKKIQMLKDRMKLKQQKFLESEKQKQETEARETETKTGGQAEIDTAKLESKNSSNCTFCLEVINPSEDCYIPAFAQFFKKETSDKKLLPILSTCGHLMHLKCYQNAEKKMKKKQIRVWSQQTKCMQCQTISNCYIVRKEDTLELTDLERAIKFLEVQYELILDRSWFKKTDYSAAIKKYKLFETFVSHVCHNPKSITMKRYVSNFLPIYSELAKEVSSICCPPSVVHSQEDFDANLDLIQRITSWLTNSDTDLSNYLILRLTMNQSLLNSTHSLSIITSIILIYLSSKNSLESGKQDTATSKIQGFVLSHYDQKPNQTSLLSLIEHNTKKICVLMGLFFDSDIIDNLKGEQYTKFNADDISCFENEEGNLLLDQAEISNFIKEINQTENYSKDLILSFNEPKTLIDLPLTHSEFQLKYYYQGCYLCGGTPSLQSNDLMVCLISGKVFCKITCPDKKDQTYTNMALHAVNQFSGQAILCSLSEAKTYLFSYPAYIKRPTIYFDRFGLPSSTHKDLCDMDEIFDHNLKKDFKLFKAILDKCNKYLKTNTIIEDLSKDSFNIQDATAHVVDGEVDEAEYDESDYFEDFEMEEGEEEDFETESSKDEEANDNQDPENGTATAKEQPPID